MLVFNGVHLLVPNEPSEQISGDACPMGYGIWNPTAAEYMSSKFPFKFQDPQIPIHIKEFICVILAVKEWGGNWAGKTVQIFSDNDSVCDVIHYMKPKDSSMQIYLREFLADPPLVVSSRFTHVSLCVRLCVRVQLTKLFNIFGSG